MAKGIYIHVPFCQSVCTYCDFPKLAGGEERIPDYVRALIREMDAYPDEWKDVETLYLGGGTPSRLPLPELDRLFQALSAKTDLSRLSEFCLEANPQDLTPEFARFLAGWGVNRVSLGVQTSHPHLLALLGRTHGRGDVLRAISALRNAGIGNVNLDFIYAIPGETFAELEADIAYATSLGAAHLSFYSLILEEKTLLWHEIRDGKLSLCSEDLEADMAEAVMDLLPARGYEQYEVSNFARPGFQSRHNVLYWNVQPYLGLGMGAHSQIGTIRFHNHPMLSRYLSAVETTGTGRAAFDPCDLAQETGLMGLRLREGLSRSAFRERFGEDILLKYPRLAKNLTEGLLELAGDRLRATRRGLLLLNYVERSFAEGK